MLLTSWTRARPSPRPCADEATESSYLQQLESARVKPPGQKEYGQIDDGLPDALKILFAVKAPHQVAQHLRLLSLCRGRS